MIDTAIILFNVSILSPFQQVKSSNAPYVTMKMILSKLLLVDNCALFDLIVRVNGTMMSRFGELVGNWFEEQGRMRLCGVCIPSGLALLALCSLQQTPDWWFCVLVICLSRLRGGFLVFLKATVPVILQGQPK
ncbi:hypothetical protein [Enterovibrio norvegicus]|uniref:hypothetical protein n=1 Tax=Enterovibrio norvegicus TaxID=188144 RepID=UPI0018EA51E9|nr:hypothetical protein [Enterovibrio norvegicus]